MCMKGGCFGWAKGNSKTRDVKLVIIGLDEAGKTTTVASLQGEPPEGITPTFGFNNADLRIGKWNILLYDLGGGSHVRSVWKKYYAEVYGIIFTVDSVNKGRIAESKAALCDIFEDSKTCGKPIVVFANKQDQEGALNKVEITKELDLQDMSTRYNFKFNVFPCSALKGFGKKIDQSINLGLRWLLNAIDESYTTIHEKVLKESAIQREEEEKERQERKERIQKLREEREKAAIEAGVAEDDAEEEEDGDVVTGNPFRNIEDQIKITEKREKKAKEREKKIKAYQQNMETMNDNDNNETAGNQSKKITKKKVKKKLKKHTADDDCEENEEDDDENGEQVHRKTIVPKIRLRSATPDLVNGELSHRTITPDDDDPRLPEDFDDVTTKKRKGSKKKKLKNNSDADERLNNSLRRRKSNQSREDDYRYTVNERTGNGTIVLVGSSENMRNDEQDNQEEDIIPRKTRKKKKRVLQTREDNNSENEDNNRTCGDNSEESATSKHNGNITEGCTKADGRLMKNQNKDCESEQDKINDSRAELFRARSFDSLDEVETETTRKNKKKLKGKIKKKKTSKDTVSENHKSQEILEEEEDPEPKKKVAKRKKKTKKNRTVPTDCHGKQLDSDTSILPPVKLPPLFRDNGHLSKLEPIELRGRLPDIKKDIEDAPSTSWRRPLPRPNSEDMDVML